MKESCFDGFQRGFAAQARLCRATDDAAFEGVEGGVGLEFVRTLA